MNPTKKILSDKHFDFFKELKIKSPNSRVYLVGGIVRDLVLGRENDDYDFLVTGVGKTELMEFLESRGGIVAESNIETAVFKFLPKSDNRVIDIALPRRETYSGLSRIPKVEIVPDIKEDLARRDFTINALALPVSDRLPVISDQDFDSSPFSVIPALSSVIPAKAGIQSLSSRAKSRDLFSDIIDPFNGLDDIKTKTIRAVSDPKERFREDPLRMLRAIRFACQLGFNIEKNTFAAIKELKTELTKIYVDNGKTKLRVSKERFMKEFLGALDSNPLKFFDLYDQSGLFDILMPEIASMKGVEQPKNFHSEGDVFVHSRLALKNLDKSASLELKLATLLHDIGKPAQFEEINGKIRFFGHDKKSGELINKIFKRYPLPSAIADKVFWLVRNHMKPLSFKKMKKSTLKNLARNPYFDDLIALTLADIRSSLRPGGKLQQELIDDALEVKEEMKVEMAKKKPVEIINGHEIIEIIKKFDKNYTGGPLVGYIKSQVNEAYDDEKIRTKKEALRLASQIAKDRLDQQELLAIDQDELNKAKDWQKTKSTISKS